MILDGCSPIFRTNASFLPPFVPRCNIASLVMKLGTPACRLYVYTE
jgi:hypothetical protein